MKRMDLLTIIGLFFGWVAILVGARLEGIHFITLLKLSAFCIVGLGTFAATCIGYTMEQIKGLPEALRKCFSPGLIKPINMLPIMMNYTKKARLGGLLALENDLKYQKDPFLKKSIQLLVDGNSIDNVRTIMEGDMLIWEQKEKVYENFFKSMGGFSPTLGIICLSLIHI